MGGQLRSIQISSSASLKGQDKTLASCRLLLASLNANNLSHLDLDLQWLDETHVSLYEHTPIRSFRIGSYCPVPWLLPFLRRPASAALERLSIWAPGQWPPEVYEALAECGARLVAFHIGGSYRPGPQIKEVYNRLLGKETSVLNFDAPMAAEHLTEEKMAEIGNLRVLRVGLSSERVTLSSPFLSINTCLRSVHLKKCRVESLLPFSSMAHLEDMSLVSCHLVDKGGAMGLVLSRCTNLQKLEFSLTTITEDAFIMPYMHSHGRTATGAAVEGKEVRESALHTFSNLSLLSVQCCDDFSLSRFYKWLLREWRNNLDEEEGAVPETNESLGDAAQTVSDKGVKGESCVRGRDDLSNLSVGQMLLKGKEGRAECSDTVFGLKPFRKKQLNIKYMSLAGVENRATEVGDTRVLHGRFQRAFPRTLSTLFPVESMQHQPDDVSLDAPYFTI